jgi:hypothetical protein
MLYPTELQAHGLSINCWQPLKIYQAIFTIFKTTRKQIRRGRPVIFPFSSTCAVAGLSGAKPKGFRAKSLLSHWSQSRVRRDAEMPFSNQNGFGFPKRTRFKFSHP